MKRERRLDQQPSSQSSPSPKISQCLLAFAREFIRMGGTPEDRQNRLNAACSAWNMACACKGLLSAMLGPLDAEH